MATYTWNGIGNWLDAVDWSAGTPPVPADSAVIAGGTVSVTSTITIASVTIEPGGATLDIEGASGSVTVTAGLANSGNLDVDVAYGGGGSSLSVGGALTNTGTLQIGSTSDNLSSSATVSAKGLVNSGAINIFGGTGAAQAALDVATAAPSTLSGTVRLYDNALLEFASGTIGAVGVGADLLLSGAGAEVSAGGGNALAKLASNAGTLELEKGASLATTKGIVNSGTLLVDTGARYSYGPTGGSTLAIGGALNNIGLVEIGNAFLGASSTLSAAALVNTGTIEITAGSSSAEAVLDITGTAPLTLSGTVELSGNALLEFASGSVQVVGAGAELSLLGTGGTVEPRIADSNDTAQDGTLAGLSRNSGTIQLQTGITLATAGAFTNAGSLFVDSRYAYGGNSGGSDIAFGGTLTNNGAILIGNSDIENATTLTAAALVNSGTIDLAGNNSPYTARSVLAIGAAAGFGVTGEVEGSVTLTGYSLLDFASGGITDIATGATLYLGSVDALIAVGGSTLANTALVGLDDNAGRLALANGASVITSGGLTNSGIISLDGDGTGGSTLSLNGTLDNLGTLQIGESFGGVTASSSVAATALVNSGAIDLFGSTILGGPEAVLDVLGAAPATLTGEIQLSGNALLEFGSGSIATIANAAEVSLDGASGDSASPHIADSSGPAKNGALDGLRVNAGILALDSGEAVATTASFQNSGETLLDTNFDSGGSTFSIDGTFHNSGVTEIGNFELARATTLAAADLDETGTLDLQGSSTAVAMATISGTADNSGTIEIGSFAELKVTGGFTQTSGMTTVGGTLAASLITVDGGLLEFTAPLAGGSGTGPIDIGGAATVAFLAAVTASETVSFIGDAASLQLGDPGQFAGSIGDFVGGDEIDLTGKTVTGLAYSGTASGGTLSVLGAGGTIANLLFLGNYTLSDFIFVADGNGGTDIELVPQVSSTSFVWNGGSGNWNTAANWNQNAVPGAAGDDAIISKRGVYTVSVTAAIIANTIDITDPTATLSIATVGQKDAIASDLVNGGVVAVDASGAGGTTFAVGGAVTNSGTLDIGNSAITASTTVTAGSLLNDGRIELTGGTGSAEAVLDIAAAAPGLLVGEVQLADNALLEFASGGIAEIGSGADLSLSGGGAGGGAQPRIADSGNTATNSALAGLDDNAGRFDLESGVSVATTGALYNSGFLSIDTSIGAGGGGLTIGGVLRNAGEIEIGSATGSLTASATLTAQGLTGDGETLIHGSTGSDEAAIDILAAAPSALTGYLALYDNALLEFSSGSIGKIAAGAELLLAGDGAGGAAQPHVADSGNLTSDGALAGLQTNAGDLAIESGVTLALGHGLDNTGDVEVDTGGTGGSTLSIAGFLTNAGYSAFVTIGNASLLNSATVTAAGISGSGAINLTGGASGAAAVLDIMGAASQELNGFLFLDGNALLEFATGEITTISEGSELTLEGAGAGNPAQPHVADSADTTTSSALTGLADNAGELSLQSGASLAITSGLANSDFLAIDTEGAGGSTLTIGGTLINNDLVEIGNSDLTASTTLSVGGLVNAEDRSIDITGGSAAEAVLAVGKPAPAVLYGDFALSGNALLEFASGGIGAIGLGSELELTGGGPGSGIQPRVADAGNAGTDSALSVLSRNAGVLDLQSGISLAITGNFENTGYVDFDEGGSGGGGISIGGTLTNAGEIDVGDYGGRLPVSATISAAGLFNSGTVELFGGAGTAQAALVITAAAPTVLTGRVFLYDDALLEFGSGSIAKIGSGAELELTGAGAGSPAQPRVADAGNTGSDSALSNLVANYGTLDLESGAALALSGDFSNFGYLYVDENYDAAGGSQLSIAGTLYNIGTTEFGPYSVSLRTPTAVTVGGLSNLGDLTLSGGAAKLTVNGEARNSGDIDIARFAKLIVSGTFTQASGTTSVNGTLEAGNLVVVSGTLQGVGTVVGNVNNSGGVLEGFSGSSAGTLQIDGSYAQGPAGILTTVLEGAASGQYSVVSISGKISLGGTLDFVLDGISLGAGQSFTVMTFTPGELHGLFSTVEAGSATGNATSVNLGDGFDIGLAYNYSAGEIIAEVLAAPSTTADTWNGGTGNWSTAANWSSGVPLPYSDVTIGGTLGGNVTLDETATIDSLTITSGYALAFATGEALTVGNGVSVAAGGSLAMAASGDLLVMGGTGSDAGVMTVAGGAEFTLDGTLTVGGELVLAGGTLDGPGTLAIGTTGTLSGSGILAGSLTNGGIVAGELTLAARGYLLNAAGSTITNPGTALLDAGGRIVNDGTVIGSGPSGVGIVFLSSGNTLINAGSIVGASGTAVAFGAGADLLILEPGAAFSGEVVGGGSGSTLQFSGTSGSLTGLGTNIIGFQLIDVDPGADWQLTGLNHIAAGDTLQIVGALSDSGSLSNGGKLTGTLTLASGGELTNASTVADAETAIYGVGGSSLVFNSGTIDSSDDTAIWLSAGGKITNGGTASTTATIAGYFYGVRNYGSLGTVTNFATISSPDGIGVASGGVVNNGNSSSQVAVISGYGTGIYLYGADGRVTNFATIEATGATGIGVDFGGSNGRLTNDGLIEATGVAGVGIGGNTGVITNNGTVDTSGSSGFGVSLSGAHGGITNAATGLIEGDTGLYLSGSGWTVADYGTIASTAGTAGTAVDFATGTHDLLEVNASTVFVGSVEGGGQSTLSFVQAGIDSMAGFSGFSTIELANGGANTLTLTSANFNGVSGSTITVLDGNSGNTVNGSALSSSEAIIFRAGTGADILTGGAGNDFFYAGGDTTMTGNGGTNAFVFLAPGASNEITDFAASSTNELVFSNTGFSLGESGATSTPQLMANASTLFVANSTGTFTNTGQRFAYDTSNGELFASSDGSGSTPQLVATLLHAPSILDSQLFFVS